MESLTPHELIKLKYLSEKNLKKTIFGILLPIVAALCIGFIPIKYFPRRWTQSADTVLEGSIASFIGINTFLLIALVICALMAWAALATYKIISIKKDLKDQRKKTVEGIVNHVDQYEGQHYVRLKKGTGVNILHFDRSNYRPLKVGDKIAFEVYEHSKILIQISDQKSKVTVKPKNKTPKIVEVSDQCPACQHPLSPNDTLCPDCGLNFT